MKQMKKELISYKMSWRNCVRSEQIAIYIQINNWIDCEDI